MSSPNESKSDKTGKQGRLPLPLLLVAAAAAVGLASIPILGKLNSKNQPNDDWSNFSQEDSIHTSIEPDENPLPTEPPTTPNDIENALDESKAVDDQLADLGEPGKPDSDTNQNSNDETNKDSKKQSNYTVKSGDTLYDIAQRSGTTPQDIADSNGIDINTPIQIGQPLNIPGSLPTQPTGTPVIPNRPVTPVIPTVANTPAGPAQPTGGRLPRPIIPTVVLPPTSSPLTPVAGLPTILPIPTGLPIGPGITPNLPSIPQTPETGRPADDPGSDNPLDKYGNAVAYQVQPFDSMSRIAKALSTSVEDLIELNGRSKIRKGEMLIVPVDNCLIKDD